jgi:hypothetical protein
MATEYQAIKPKDITRINIKEPGELLWWSYILGTTLENLLATVEKVGNSAEEVRRYLKQDQ